MLQPENENTQIGNSIENEPELDGNSSFSVLFSTLTISTYRFTELHSKNDVLVTFSKKKKRLVRRAHSSKYQLIKFSAYTQYSCMQCQWYDHQLVYITVIRWWFFAIRQIAIQRKQQHSDEKETIKCNHFKKFQKKSLK